MHTKYILFFFIILTPGVRAELTPKSHIWPGGVEFQATADLNYGYEDNITYQKHHSDATGSGLLSMAPVLSWSASHGPDKYYLMYSGDYRHYTADSADDYNDHFLHLSGEWRYGLKHGVTVILEEALGHEDRGRDTTEGFSPAQFRQFGINSPLHTRLFNSEVRYSYGAPEGRGKAILALNHKTLRFGNDSNARRTDDDFYQYIRSQAWSENGLSAELIDRYTSRTRFRYGVMMNQRHYDTDSDKDTSEYYLLYGLKTQFSSRTLVDINISWLYKTFDHNADAGDFNGLNWDIKGEWRPLRQSVFSVHSAQQIKDPSEAGGYILVSSYGVSYKHFWLGERLSAQLDYSYITEDYKKQSNKRRDKNSVFTAGLHYEATPAVSLGVEYKLDVLKSNKDTYSFYIGQNEEREVIRTPGYDNSLIMLTAKVQI